MLKLISRIALPVTIFAILYLLISGNLLSSAPLVIIVQLFAIGLSIWARRSFQVDQFSIHAEPEEGHLLLNGPYQFIRHPMYAAALILTWSALLGHLSLLNLLVSLSVTAVIAIRITIEEQFLRTQYPNYTEYSHRTKRLIPLII